MGTASAAIATVFAQIISVIVSFILISKKDLPFTVKKKNIRIHKTYLRKMTAFGAPIALQEILGEFCVRVPISYLSVPYRTGNTNVLYIAVDSLCWIYALAAKKQTVRWQALILSFVLTGNFLFINCKILTIISGSEVFKVSSHKHEWFNNLLTLILFSL